MATPVKFTSINVINNTQYAHILKDGKLKDSALMPITTLGNIFFIPAPTSWSSKGVSSSMSFSLNDRATYQFEIYHNSYGRIAMPLLYTQTSPTNVSTSTNNYLTILGCEYIYNGNDRLIRLRLRRSSANTWTGQLDYSTGSTWTNITSGYTIYYRQINL